MAHAMKASAGYLSSPHPDLLGQKAPIEENGKEVCLVLISPNRRLEQCLVAKKRDIMAFPAKSVTGEERWRSSSGTADSRFNQTFLGAEQGIQKKKGDSCNEDGK